MIGTTKQIEWANDILKVAQKQQEIFNGYIDVADETSKDVLECLDAIKRGFKKFNDINDAGQVIYYGKDFKYKRKIDELLVYKTMALLGEYKKISEVDRYINIVKDYKNNVKECVEMSVMNPYRKLQLLEEELGSIERLIGVLEEEPDDKSAEMIERLNIRRLKINKKMKQLENTIY